MMMTSKKHKAREQAGFVDEAMTSDKTCQSKHSSLSAAMATDCTLHNYRLTANGQFVHNDRATPYCVVRLGGLNLNDAQPRSYAVFLCVLHGYVRVMTSRVGTSKDVLVSLSQSANPIRFVTFAWRLGRQIYNLLSTRSIMANGFQTCGVWCYKLPDPFGKIAYLPLSASELAEMLEISPKTALRICHDQRQLKAHELIYLQMKMFGYIPDPQFYRYRVYFCDGKLLCHDIPNFEMSSGELAHLYVWKTHYLQTKDILAAAKIRVQELEELITPPKPSNLIDFKQAAAKRQAPSHNWEA
ncbi:hypothetical protein FK216_09780 [Moraxellaceae bacterium AER2_44_116]|nr:hypothetical protein [Moraxellaceae bacterium]TQC97176.1 hypothetical protein FK216_09780 [Moraxellaceae bacterium AER2_44_116]